MQLPPAGHGDRAAVEKTSSSCRRRPQYRAALILRLPRRSPPCLGSRRCDWCGRFCPGRSPPTARGRPEAATRDVPAVNGGVGLVMSRSQPCPTRQLGQAVETMYITDLGPGDEHRRQHRPMRESRVAV